MQVWVGPAADATQCLACPYLRPPVCCTTGVADADAVLEAGVKEQVVVVPGKIFWAKAVNPPPPLPTPDSPTKAACATSNGNSHGKASANGHTANGGTPAAAPGDKPVPPCPYFRVSFASASEAQLQEGFRRLRAAIRDCMPNPPPAEPPAAPAAAPAGAVHPSTPTKAAGGGGTAPASPLHLSTRVSMELPGPPWSHAAEGRLPVPAVLAEAAVALGPGVCGNGEPLAPGVGDDGLTAAAEAAEQIAAAGGR
jgi:hypothetical protein